jgi:hypothetical protein
MSGSKAEDIYSDEEFRILTSTGIGGVTWTAGRRSSSCRKAAEKLKGGAGTISVHKKLLPCRARLPALT